MVPVTRTAHTNNSLTTGIVSREELWKLVFFFWRTAFGAAVASAGDVSLVVGCWLLKVSAITFGDRQVKNWSLKNYHQLSTIGLTQKLGFSTKNFSELLYR